MKLLHKILLALVTVSLLGLLAMLIIAQTTFSYGFLRYLRDREVNQLERLVPSLTEHYQTHGTWDQFRSGPRQWHRLLREVHQDTPRLDEKQEAALREHLMVNGHAHKPRIIKLDGFLARQFAARVFLLDSQRHPVIGRPPPDPDDSEKLPITVDGVTQGWVGLVLLKDVDTTRERNFQRHMTHALVVAAVVCLLLATFASWLLARHLSGPVKQLAQATGKVRRGDLSSRVDIQDGSEIGELANDFNAMVQTLESNEQARQRWVTDIAHELRTPLGVLQGEVEAMQDGLRPFDRDSLDSLRAEITQLSALVDDLRHLAQADSGILDCSMQILHPAELIDEAVRAFSPLFAEQTITLEWHPSPAQHTVEMLGDARRLRQMLNNILENTLRYTQRGGRCAISLQGSESEVQWCIDDSEPGVASADLPRIFDRLFRAETSRNREFGGSGLGLAIVQSIVHAHSGTISASHNDWGGLRLTITFPAPSQTGGGDA